MDFLNTMDFEKTIRDYEFTRKARQQIHHVVTSESFEDMSCEEILKFFIDEMDIIPFCDHLKRYIFHHTDMEAQSLQDVPEERWQNAISYAFDVNNAPHSFTPTTTRWNATVKSWLSAERVRRSTVFLLGFGLKMSPDDVSRMLTKALEEEDFRPDDPTEVIYRYCFANGLPYSHAFLWLEKYAALPESDKSAGFAKDFPENEDELLSCLSSLKAGRLQESRRMEKRRSFLSLYRRCQEIIAGIYNRDEESKPKSGQRIWQPEEISPADLEGMLCGGIPHTSSGNLVRANLSLLNRHFESFRPSRQHLEGVLNSQLYPDRYDLLTLSFFIFSQLDIPGEERLRRFLDETNPMMEACGMCGLYPVHPYEAFLLICTIGELPLALYQEVWELSFENSSR